MNKFYDAWDKQRKKERRKIVRKISFESLYAVLDARYRVSPPLSGVQLTFNQLEKLDSRPMDVAEGMKEGK